MVLSVDWADGFDHYPVSPSAAPFGIYSTWTRSGSTPPTAAFQTGFKGRGKCLQLTADIVGGRLQRAVTPSNQISQHIALNMYDMDLSNVKPLFSWRDTVSAVQFSMKQMPTGRLGLYRGDGVALLATTAFPFTENTVHRLNFAIDFSNPISGSFDCWVDGDKDVKGFSIAGVDLLQTAINTVDAFALEQEGYGAGADQGWKYRVDDAMFCVGAAVNIGEMELITDGPTGDVTKVWTPSTGTDNFANVDEIPPSIVDYNSSTVPGNIDLQSFPILPTSPDSIFCVSQIFGARKEEAGTRAIASAIKPGAAPVIGANQNLSTDDLWYYQHHLKNPETTAAWLAAERAATPFGYKDAI